MTVGVTRAANYGDVGAAIERCHSMAGSPLDALIRPGTTVCLKPNWIAGSRESFPEEWEQIITHPRVLEAGLDFVAKRMREGRIVLADAPQTDSDFSLIAERSGLKAIDEAFRDKHENIDLEIVDLRREWWIRKGNVTVRREGLPGDPRGATLIELGDRSEFVHDSSNHEYYGADYDFADTREHHTGGRHEYLISRSVLQSDVFVNLPKLKTHKKAGVTLSLKNLVGINADKNYLPHYSLGAPTEGGDEFPATGHTRRLESFLSKNFKKLVAKSGGKAPVWGPLARKLGAKAFGESSKVVRSGNWWGNDTLWRMCLDLNKALLWFNPDGTIRDEPRPYFSIVDGVIAGEGDGPVDASANNLGVLVAGQDPFAVDLVCTRLIGLDWRKIPILAKALEVGDLPISSVQPEDIHIVTDGQVVEGVDALDPIAFFRPHFGWRGRIELESQGMPA